MKKTIQLEKFRKNRGMTLVCSNKIPLMPFALVALLFASRDSYGKKRRKQRN